MDTALSELVAYLEGQEAPHIVFDPQYRIVAANAAYRSQFSPQASVLGRTCYEVSHHFNVPCDQAGETCPLVKARQTGRHERVLHLHHTPRGEAYVNIELMLLKGASGVPRYFVEKMEEVQLARGRASDQGLVGRSPAFRRLIEQVHRVAPSAASVLLLGESGTGKELVARALHEASPRKVRPLVVVDCASLTDTLFESEVFGHERGAFTGASTAKQGLVEAADGGTLFLDEVGDIPLSMQVKLLRLLESGTFRRVGSTELRHTDVRVVAATHRQIRQMVADGRFREDLYHRLNTFPIHLPALRDRQEDVPLLAEALLQRLASDRRLSLSRGAVQLLKRHPVQGNVRGLRNVLERAVLLCDGPVIDTAVLQEALAMDEPDAPMGLGGSAPTRAFDDALGASDQGNAKDRLRQEAVALVQRSPGRRAEVAAALGISERTLYRWIRQTPSGA